MERPIPIEWPKDGLVETWGFSDQPQNSAREYQNVRLQDCTNGRLRGAQRAGLSKYCSSALGASKAIGLTGFFVNNRQVSYAAIASGSETVTWSTATPSKKDCNGGKVDRQGNVYALDGNAGLVKYSSDGKKVWQLSVEVEDTDHVIRALSVDVNENVYVGVSEGGDQEKAKLFCFEQIEDDKTEKLWEIETKEYIEDMVISQGKLYTVQNNVERKRSYVRIYDFIDSATPTMVKQWRVPHPANSVAVKEDGSVIVACEANGDEDVLYWREPDPLHSGLQVDSVDWTPKRLDNSDKRIWSWYQGDTIDQTDVSADIETGVETIRLRDSSRNKRHLFAPLDNATIEKGPVYAEDALQQHKGIRFNGTNVAPRQSLTSLPNGVKGVEFADQQRTLVPCYTGSQFALFIVCRPSESTPESEPVPRWLFGQDRDDAESGSDDHILFINASSDNGTTLPPTASAGDIFWFLGEVPVNAEGNSGNSILHASFVDRADTGTGPDGSTTTNPGNVAIIDLIWDNALANTPHSSSFQVNGSPIDAFTGIASTSLQPSWLGIFKPTIKNGNTNPASASQVGPFLGDILEILCLDRKNKLEDSSSPTGVLSFDDLEAADAGSAQTVNDKTLIEGYLAHKYGAQVNLPWGSLAVGNHPHPFGITGTSPDMLSGPPNQAGTGVSTAQALANKMFACVVKYNAEGKIVWTANEMELESAARSGGFGYAVAINSDGNIYSVGPNPTISGGTQQVRMIIDEGDTFSLDAADGAWSASFPANAVQDYKYPRIDVDEFDNLYIPYFDTGANTASVRVYQKDGTVLHSKLLTSPIDCTGVAVDRRIPDYRSDLSVKRAEHVIVFGNAETQDADTVAKVKLVASTQTSGSVRELYSMGVSAGDIKRFTSSTVTTPTGGSGALDSAAQYVQSTSLFRIAYWTDGVTYRKYDPITNEVVAYECNSAGEMPPKCSLIESWRGRIVLARSADNPHNWFMSKKDEPHNFDYFPPVPNETQAVAGSTSTAGLAPDIINSLVPYSQDRLLFGCDHSIWELVGDPAAGGRLELVSDITGMAFGRPWCKDPDGVLYFVGSKGGLFRWVPGAKPERISVLRIERTLQSINLATHHIKLAWNYQDEGIHMLQCPFGAGGTQVSHFFWEIKVGAFAKDVFGTSTNTNVQPTDVLVLDGDDFNDRVVLFGCEDGYVRKWDSSAKSDDTQTDGTTKIPIDAYVTIFPLPGLEQQSGMDMQYQGLTVVLGERDDGCRYELFASDEPDSMGVFRASGNLSPGRNAPQWTRITGPYCGIRLRNAAAEERFSFERGYIYAIQAGMSRPYSTK